jgi:hypothetical protein
MHFRVLDSFLHELRAGRDSIPAHDELRTLYLDAIEKMTALSDGLYKRSRSQVDDEAA